MADQIMPKPLKPHYRTTETGARITCFCDHKRNHKDTAPGDDGE